MSFWSSQTLTSRLQQLVPGAQEFAVDCNSITLNVGREIFVTPNVEEINTRTVTQLSASQPFVLPPSQFAFLTTEEKVVVPKDAMAFISMKATFKLMGLINVSGFHVDPGYSGPLLFSVYNAGPSPVHLRRGLPLFLIWFADLDEQSEKHKRDEVPAGIPPKYLNKLSGTTDSVPALEERLVQRIEVLEKNQVFVKAVLAALLTAAVGIGGAIYPLFLAPYYKASEVSTKDAQPPGLTLSIGGAKVVTPEAKPPLPATSGTLHQSPAKAQ